MPFGIKPAKPRNPFGVQQAQDVAARYTGGGAGLSNVRQGLFNQKSAATSRAFDNLRSRTRERAAASGFGYQQPIAQAADLGIETERARAIGDIGNEVDIEAAPLEMQGAQLGLQAGRDLDSMQERARRRKAGLFKEIASRGARAASGYTGNNPFLKAVSSIGKIAI